MQAQFYYFVNGSSVLPTCVRFSTVWDHLIPLVILCVQLSPHKVLSLVAAQLITGNARAAAVIIIVQVNKTIKKTGFDFIFFF